MAKLCAPDRVVFADRECLLNRAFDVQCLRRRDMVVPLSRPALPRDFRTRDMISITTARLHPTFYEGGACNDT